MEGRHDSAISLTWPPQPPAQQPAQNPGAGTIQAPSNPPLTGPPVPNSPPANPPTMSSPASSPPPMSPPPMSPPPVGASWNPPPIRDPDPIEDAPWTDPSVASSSGIQPSILFRPASRVPGVQSVTSITSQSGSFGASTGAYLPNGDRYFKSRRIVKGSLEKPWLEKKDPMKIWQCVIPFSGLLIGLAIAAVFILDGVKSVTNHKYCKVLDEKFTTWNPEIWTKEVELGGYGNGQFEMTTDTTENVYIENNTLIIKPTLQDPSLIDLDTVIDLRDNGCTGSQWYDCLATTNTTNGTIVNPVKCGRINTKLGASIKYGRVEVEAKLPAGDWLWPAIWMLPKDNVYGDWPRSGEIDIMESRGNHYSYPLGGNNIVTSCLHFGPNYLNDGCWRNIVKRQAQHETFADRYHTFGVEWTPKYIFTYIDTRLLHVMYTSFLTPFWEYGRFPLADRNGTALHNPWLHPANASHPNATPFDQDFYLVINIAVGGTNGWFKDGMAGKPWLDGSPTARRDFWEDRGRWGRSWGLGGKDGEGEGRSEMRVRRVRMWQQAGWNGCKAK